MDLARAGHSVVIKQGDRRGATSVVLDGMDISDTTARIDVSMNPMDVTRVTFEHFIAVEYSGEARVDVDLRLIGPRTMTVASALRSLADEIEAEQSDTYTAVAQSEDRVAL